MSDYDGYIKLNEVELPIRTKKGLFANGKKGRYFVWRNNEYFISDFIELDSRPGDCWVYPDYITAVQAGKDINPIYIEIIGRYAVNIYIEGSRCHYV